MTWGAELFKIRRQLRDPDGNIWSDAFLRHLYNETQKDLQNRTLILEDVATQRVPGLYHFSYMHDWEWQFLPASMSQFYQCLQQHSGYVFAHRWEVQETSDIAADVSDYGIHFCHPWEAFMGQTPGEKIKFKFPSNMRNLKYIAYDEEPIAATSEKRVQISNPSYLTTEGRPFAYYQTDDIDATYVLYPRPSTSWQDEIAGEGVALYATDDTEDITTGTIAVRTGDSDTDTPGVAVDIVGADDNVWMAYDVSPTDMDTVSDPGDFPAYLQKYVRYGVISRAYGANTDGRIPTLAAYWGARYIGGIKVVKRFGRNRHNDRDYRLTTKGEGISRTHRHPRLPSAYPAVNP